MDDNEWKEVSRKYYLTDDSRISTMTLQNYERLFKIVEASIIEIQKSTSVRLIIIETWLILDYCIRDIILGTLNLHNKTSENYDLRYKLLPFSFERCVEFLMNLINSQRNLPIKPYEPSRLNGSTGFWLFISKNHKNIYDKIIELEDEYLLKTDPKYKEYKSNINDQVLGISIKTILIRNNIEYRFMSDEWLNSSKALDEEWFKKMKWINNARNIAAHSPDLERIYEKLGINGDNKIEKLRTSCIEQIEKLLKINIKDNPNPKW